MNVLAIDPGPTESAFVEWDGNNIGRKGKIPNDDLKSILKETRSLHVVVEMIASYGMPVGAETFETCVFIGQILEAAGGGTRIYRKDVKMHLCGSMRAKDGNIRQALIDRLGAPGTRKAPGATYGIKGDEWQALAVAVTYWDTRR